MQIIKLEEDRGDGALARVIKISCFSIQLEVFSGDTCRIDYAPTTIGGNTYQFTNRTVELNISTGHWKTLKVGDKVDINTSPRIVEIMEIDYSMDSIKVAFEDRRLHGMYGDTKTGWFQYGSYVSFSRNTFKDDIYTSIEDGKQKEEKKETFSWADKEGKVSVTHPSSAIAIQLMDSVTKFDYETIKSLIEEGYRRGYKEGQNILLI